tara:strand:+ start:60 stop:698 length:639 start_codon:yes stop_codon:yes gene_type:complete
MKESLYIFLLLINSYFYNTYCQIDNSINSFGNSEKKSFELLAPKKNIPLIGRSISDPNVIDLTDPSIDYNRERSNEKFINPNQQYLSRLKSPEDKKNPNMFRQNQYLGDFKLNGNSIEIIFRDHEYFDGDRVRILVNDIVIVENVLLENSFKGLNYKLKSGFNKIDFLALNQGESGPNTAEIRVFNEKGGLVTSNQWNLATGVKATLIVVKD